MKRFVKSIFLLAMALGISWYLIHKQLISLQSLGEGMEKHALVVVFIMLIQALVVAISSLRSVLVFRLTGILLSFRNSFAANCVGLGLGQWLPASMVFTETIRIGILLKEVPKVERKNVWHKITVAAVFDRALAQGVMFVVGGLGALVFLAQNDLPAEKQHLILLLGLFGIAAGLVIGVILFWLPRYHVFFRRTILGLLPGKVTSMGFVQSLFGKFDGIIEELFEEDLPNTWRSPRVYQSMVLSAMVLLFSSLAYYLCGFVVEDHVPFLTLMSVIPMLSIITILPIGIAGFGGNQLAAMAGFALFGANPQTSGTLTFLCAVTGAAVNTLLAVPFLVAKAVQGEAKELVAE